MHLYVSTAAKRHVQERGGLLFVWFEDFNSDFWTRHVGTKPPRPGPSFVEYELPMFNLFLDDRFNAPYELTVDLTRWPWRRIVVRTDDDPGGGAVGDAVVWDGGDCNWDWPSGGIGGDGGGSWGGDGGHGGGHGHVSV